MHSWSITDTLRVHESRVAAEDVLVLERLRRHPESNRPLLSDPELSIYVRSETLRELAQSEGVDSDDLAIEGPVCRQHPQDGATEEVQRFLSLGERAPALTFGTIHLTRGEAREYWVEVLRARLIELIEQYSDAPATAMAQMDMLVRHVEGLCVN